MSVPERDCPSCHHPNTGDAMFCSKCGGKMPAPAAAAPAPEPEPPPEPAPEPAASPEARQPARRVLGSAKTMLGMAGPDQEELIAAAKAAAAKKKARASEQAPAKEKRAPSPTVRDARPLGARVADLATDPPPSKSPASESPASESPASESPASESPASESPASESPAAANKASSEPLEAPPKRRVVGAARTMLGMPTPGQGEIAAGIEQAKQKAAARRASEGAEPEEDAPPAKLRSLDPMTNRTMLGQPAPRAALEAAKKDSAQPPSSSDEGEPDASDGEDPEAPRGRSEVLYPTNSAESDALNLALPQRRVPKGLAYGALALGVLVLLVGGVALAWSLMSGESAVSATVVQVDGSEQLEIHVAGAEEGTQVRFRGEEQALEAGRARFALAADALTLGENELSVDVISPDGEVSTDTVSLQLDLRVRADLGPLQGTPPALDVVVEAPAGSEVTLDGEALELDAQGRATRRFEVDPSAASAEGMVEHVVRYRVQPPEGETAQGELRTRIPHTTMQVDRPGPETVTDSETITVAGAVGPSATVTIDGEEVEVNGGRFLSEVALPEVGEQTVEVIAREPGKAPRVARLSVRRVADLAEEAASFEANEDLTYGRISSNPTTFRGQNVAFEGVVYNVVVREGRSQLQILVSDCPEGERCPLWVEYGSATDAELRQRVRVLGTVAGEQQFRSQSGQIRTVPSVQATFVLDAPSRRR